MIALLIEFTLALAFNVDSVFVVQNLWRNPTMRQAIVAQAGNIGPESEASINATMTQLNDLSLPVGWNQKNWPPQDKDWPIKIIGFMLSAAAASQGSPFWFDLLRKIVGEKAQTSQKSKSDKE